MSTPSAALPLSAPGPRSRPRPGRTAEQAPDAHVVRDRLLARRARIRRLRLRAVGTTLAVFMVVWGVVFVRLTTGHDPALTASAARSQASQSAVTATSAATPSASAGTTSSSSGSGSGSGSSGSSSSSSSAPAAVQTSQS